MKKKKRILIAPLDWGIGHATRVIPIIENLLKKDYEVIIAADKSPLKLLHYEFPKLETIRLKGYNIWYSNILPMWLTMTIQIPKILFRINKEHQSLKSIIKNYNIHGVISDNRFGLFNKNITSIFITHQLEIQSPYFKKLIKKINYFFILKYNECWVFDDPKINLAGILSKPNILPENSKYLGIHSRFKKTNYTKKYDLLVMISGPEPQRTKFEDIILKQLKKINGRHIVVLGKPGQSFTKKIANIEIKSHLKASELNKVILQSDLIICRPGYSSIMDLTLLEKNAAFIPTPGQTEQIYLSKKLKEEKICNFQNQKNINLRKLILESKGYKGLSSKLLQKTNWENLFKTLTK